MSLREVIAECGVPLDELLVALKLPSGTSADLLVKDLVQQGKIAEVTALKEAAGELHR